MLKFRGVVLKYVVSEVFRLHSAHRVSDATLALVHESIYRPLGSFISSRGKTCVKLCKGKPKANN